MLTTTRNVNVTQGHVGGGGGHPPFWGQVLTRIGPRAATPTRMTLGGCLIGGPKSGVAQSSF